MRVRLASARWVTQLRCPYLDEAVVAFLGSLPGHLLADLDAPPGAGDKRLLRAAAVAVGLPAAGSARLVKRAIQFGSRIAKLGNRERFGAVRRGDGAALFSASEASRSVAAPFWLPCKAT